MKKVLIMFLFIGAAVSLNAQKIKVIEGDLGALKGQEIFRIEYDYSDMGVGKFDSEQDYINKKVKEYNDDEPGRGDKWKESWISDRKGRFEPKFEELINKYTENVGTYIGNEKADAKYTMILHTTFTEPGFNVYVTKKPSMINVELIIVETANRDNVVCRIVSKNNPGRTFGAGDFDTGLRITEAYAMAGKGLGKYLSGQWK